MKTYSALLLQTFTTLPLQTITKPLLLTGTLISLLTLTACGGGGSQLGSADAAANTPASQSSIAVASSRPASLVALSSTTTSTVSVSSIVSSTISSATTISNSSNDSAVNVASMSSMISSSKPSSSIAMSSMPISSMPRSSTSSSSRASSASTSEAPAVRWSNTTTWPSGQLPKAGENVDIPQGQVVELDITPPALGSVSINGALKFKDVNLEFTAKNIMVHGRLEIGTEAKPFMSKAVITLTDADMTASQMGMGTRGIMAMGGTLELHGTAPQPVWTNITAHAAQNTQNFSLQTTTNWSVGDEFVIAPTDFYRIGHTEKLTVASAAGSQLQSVQNLQQARWGLLQYIDNNGVTLAQQTSVTNKVLDERAEVGNLTRNIIIQSIDDDAWRNNAFGAHVMVMYPGEAHIEGVEFRRVGQAGLLGRYPFHWHMWSYNTDGTERGDATGQYIKTSSIHDSTQRCVVIHGTNGATVENNLCYNIRGHGIFLEDAVERRNIIKNNLVLSNRLQTKLPLLSLHENFVHQGGPSGFWLTNPDNVVTGNVAADADGMGFWLAFPVKPLGLSKAVSVMPAATMLGVFANNKAHSNQLMGAQLDIVPIDDLGTTTGNGYQPTNTGFTGADAIQVKFELSDVVTYKHEQISYWNRGYLGDYNNFIIADFDGFAFSGAAHCFIHNALVVGESLNNANKPTPKNYGALGAASYHSQCDIYDNIFVNLPAVQGKPSGAFGTADYYIHAMDKGLVRNKNNRLINTHGGYRSPSPNTLADGKGRGNFGLAGALWDPYGYWGPAGNFWVIDHPFLTDLANCQNTKDPIHGNDKSCPGPYYGVEQMVLDGDNTSERFRNRPIKATRNETGSSWFIDEGRCTPVLGTMRGFTAVKGGSYTLSFPAGFMSGDGQFEAGSTIPCGFLEGASPPPSKLEFFVTNVLTAQDGFTLAVPYNGASTPTVAIYTILGHPNGVPELASYTKWKNGDADWKESDVGGLWRPMRPAASKAEFDSVIDGSLYWQDRANNLLWIHVRRSGMTTEGFGDPLSDIGLYQQINFLFDNK